MMSTCQHQRLKAGLAFPWIARCGQFQCFTIVSFRLLLPLCHSPVSRETKYHRNSYPFYRACLITDEAVRCAVPLVLYSVLHTSSTVLLFLYSTTKQYTVPLHCIVFPSSALLHNRTYWSWIRYCTVFSFKMIILHKPDELAKFAFPEEYKPNCLSEYGMSACTVQYILYSKLAMLFTPAEKVWSSSHLELSSSLHSQYRRASRREKS